MFCACLYERCADDVSIYITFGDETGVTHSQIIEEDGKRKVYVHFERPIEEVVRAFE